MPHLTRLVLLLALVTSSVALAHAFVLDFIFNRSVPNFASDAGIVPLQWLDMEEAGGAAVVRLRASRRALSPFDRPDANDVLVLSDDIPLGSPIDFHDWDARDAGEGCWQPYAILYDVIDGEQLARAHARVTVVHGDNVPPSLWVMTPREKQPDDAGRLQLQWDLDEPDDYSTTQISWVAADGERGLVVGGLPLSAGTGSASYAIDTRRLPRKPVWFHIEMRSGDAGVYCDAWWMATSAPQLATPEPFPMVGSQMQGAQTAATLRSQRRLWLLHSGRVDARRLARLRWPSRSAAAVLHAARRGVGCPAGAGSASCSADRLGPRAWRLPGGVPGAGDAVGTGEAVRSHDLRPSPLR